VIALRAFKSCVQSPGSRDVELVRLAAQAGNGIVRRLAITTKGQEKRAKNGERVKLTIIDGNEQMRRMQEAVAHRAYAIFESRGSGSWRELEDWRQAESELVRPLCCGRMTNGDSLWIGTDARIFEQGTIEIWVAPRKITICGKPRADKADANRKLTRPCSGPEMIFRVLDLSVDIDPSQVTVKFSGPSLEILARKAQGKRQEARTAAA
jgi:HSP20 family molecular chaperone IbpA